MARLIDGDALIENFGEWYVEEGTEEGFIGTMKDLVRMMPTVEERKGKWIDMADFEQCSCCKGTHLKEFQSYYGKATWIKTPFCPYCGARMKEEQS